MIVAGRALIGLLAGFTGAIVSGLLFEPSGGWVEQLLVRSTWGLLIGVLVGPRMRTVGAGMMWGQALALVAWVVSTLTIAPLIAGDRLLWELADVHDRFGDLLATMVGFGVVGGGLFAVGARLFSLVDPIPEDQQIIYAFPPVLQASIVGGVSGLISARLFLIGIESAEFFDLVSGIVGASSTVTGGLLHYVIAVIIAVSFALLFHRDIRGPGSAIAWGMSYGIIWWVLGPLTLLPLLTGTTRELSAAVARENFPALVAHIIYGASVGIPYAAVNRVWDFLFVDSDPVNRVRASIGARSLRAALLGQAGGLFGGLLFTVVMAQIGALPDIAGLVGSDSRIVGFLVNLVVAFLIGTSFGLLFQRTVQQGSGIGWGLLYGLLWWMVGPLTLFPALLRQPIDWSAANAIDQYPALIGHLMFGAGLGLLYQTLARRHDPDARVPLSRYGETAPAMWMSTLVIMVMIPLVLGS